MVLLSTCRTKGVASGAFVESANRLNVAITRAKRHLLVVGRAEALQKGSLWSAVMGRAAKMAPRGALAIIRSSPLAPGAPGAPVAVKTEAPAAQRDTVGTATESAADARTDEPAAPSTTVQMLLEQSDSDSEDDDAAA